MDTFAFSAYEIDRILHEYGKKNEHGTSRSGSKKHKGKWSDQRGVNPLMLMGLDRS